uniref:Putative neurotoxin LTDF 05-04 n=1 Tax=Dolomedes fimbriatus TaxID=1432569 RepID=A0A0K1D8U3_9ARAC|nr:putative neurotoxin LTDF 05-04 [Dolomedes fimbriatus]
MKFVAAFVCLFAAVSAINAGSKEELESLLPSAREKKTCIPQGGECDPYKKECQCCGDFTYCGCYWGVTIFGQCKCKYGNIETCYGKYNCDNRSAWTSKPFNQKDCHRGG